MGLFDKKTCDVCGGQIGLLGNRKLDDGNLCKDCAAKLSPFFTGRRKSTVADIKEQLAYREQNKANLGSFKPTLTIEGGKKVYIAEPDQKFIVTSSSNWQSANPDIIDFSMVNSLTLSVKEDREELKEKDADGKAVPFDPPRFKYGYEFDVQIIVNHPYFDEINFVLNDDVEIDNPESELYKQFEERAKLLKKTITGSDVIDSVECTYQEQEAPEEVLPEGAWKCECGAVNTAKFCTECGKPQPEEAQAKKFCPSCGHELNGAKFCPNCGANPEAPVEEVIPEGAWKCECGAINTAKFCTECGKPQPAEEAPAKKFCPNCGHELNGEKFCPNCGAKEDELPEGAWKCECGAVNTAKFCTQCGKPQPAAAPVTKFCPNCGHELNGAKFCPNCGAKIGE